MLLHYIPSYKPNCSIFKVATFFAYKYREGVPKNVMIISPKRVHNTTDLGKGFFKIFPCI